MPGFLECLMGKSKRKPEKICMETRPPQVQPRPQPAKIIYPARRPSSSTCSIKKPVEPNVCQIASAIPEDPCQKFKMQQGGDHRPMTSVLVTRPEPDCAPTDTTFENELPKDPPPDPPARDPNFKYAKSIETLDQDNEVDRQFPDRQPGNVNFQYRNLGAFDDSAKIKPKTLYDEDSGSNQALFDIVMVRLALINEDFVHRSRYLSGEPFAFTHDSPPVPEPCVSLPPRPDPCIPMGGS